MFYLHPSHPMNVRPKFKERGISLFIVLIALLLLSIAAAGLIRSVDTGALVIGNRAFKQATTSAADRTTDAAVNWISMRTGGNTLFNSAPSEGYYATNLDQLDITGRSATATRILADWNNDNCAYAAGGSFANCIKTSPPVVNGDFTTQYLIMRMCKTTGDPNALANNCAKPSVTATTGSPKKGELKYGDDKRFAVQSGPFFRIVVRAVGPRNTVSYTESYVHF